MHILIIDDNEELVFGLKKLLDEASYHVHIAYNLKKGAIALERQNYDLVILDWMLPDGSGVNFLEQQRKLYLETTPVLILSSKGESVEKVEALDAGADDYMQKPFSNIELMARIRVLLRRESKQKQSQITIDNLSVNLSTREVLVNHELVSLSKKEFELLEFLLLNSNVILTRYQINEHLNRDFDAFRSSNLVDAHIKNLRKKLGTASTVIQTVRGVGFRVKKT
ncbi:MAG: DNA-binding response regulator, OmpR family, contains REC and winged-helix (WHTH) domain [uncultured Sulfurovum sp.]|uniref:DNA-binding response regulator, OmpR family, contains REC and winged-helix (WHTH) domain n=1 Tax=uncultured Sulfurovum sp. TaxID=269237 RepID=A0A6S6TL76_9BACT|nr:MAG: DNA-binding response regulator, OmpR family, contains REC and winged-helix (WHTH) domain [uncultured Sulfurovum sp.]